MKKFYLALLGLIAGGNYIYAATGDTFVVDNFTYSVIDEASKTVKVTKFASADNTNPEVTVPRNVVNNGSTYKVTEIGENAFYNSKTITTVTLPTSLTTIGNYAFFRSTIKSISFPSLVATIGNYAFQQSELESVNFVAGNTTVGNYAFDSAKITEFTYPTTGALVLGEYALSNNPLSTFTISSGLKSLGEGTFSGCMNLTAEGIKLMGNSAYKMQFSMLIGTADNCVYYIDPELDNITIPLGTVKIGKGACRKGAVENLTLTQTLRTLDDYCFADCVNLKKIKFAKTAITANNSFYGCTALEEVDMSPLMATSDAMNAVTGMGMFQNCTSLKKVIMPNNALRTSPTYWFTGCSSLQDIVWTVSPLTMGIHNFEGCTSLETFVNPETCWGGSRANLFYGSGLVSYSILSTPEYYDEVEESNIRMKSIASKMFTNSERLNTVYLGGTISSIDTYVFENCKSLENIYIENPTPPTVKAATFSGIPEGVNLYVPTNSVALYKANAVFSNSKFNIIGYDFASAVKATKVEFVDEGIKTVNVGKTETVTPEITPANVTSTNLCYVSENPEIATVDNAGVVTGVAPGQATIKAFTTDGSALKASYVVDVKSVLTGVDALGNDVENIEVYTLDGIKVFQGARNAWKATENGIYILRAGSKTEKVIVK